MDERASHSFLAWVMSPMSSAEGMMTLMMDGVCWLPGVNRQDWKEKGVYKEKNQQTVGSSG